MATKPSKEKSKTPKAKKAKAPKERVVSAAPRPEGQESAKARKRAARPPCRIAKCKRPYRAKGYCRAHYRMWRHGAYGNARYKQCGDINCAKPMVRNRFGYCEEHYQNYFVKGQAVAKVAAEAPEKKPAEKPAAAAG